MLSMSIGGAVDLAGKAGIKGSPANMVNTPAALKVGLPHWPG